jgi:hypothetical protein
MRQGDGGELTFLLCRLDQAVQILCMHSGSTNTQCGQNNCGHQLLVHWFNPLD